MLARYYPPLRPDEQLDPQAPAQPDNISVQQRHVLHSIFAIWWWFNADAVIGAAIDS